MRKPHHKELRAVELERLKALRHVVDLYREKEEAERLLWANEKFRRDLPASRKTGRPPKWLGELGYQLVCAVEEIKAKGNQKTADAVRMLRKSSLTWRAYGERVLQNRYQEARKFWAPWFERDRELDAAMEKWRARRASNPPADVPETNCK